jgi:two-component sensor histidine kinase/tetratricopeptide (TPR) repeat protein
MKEIFWALSLLLAGMTAYTQSSRTDSLSKLIDAAADENEKARLLVQRSRSYAPAQTPQALADAQQSLAIYQQNDNTKGQVDAYLQLSGLYSRQNKYLLALSVDSTSFALAEKINYKQGIALACSNMGRNLQQMGRFEEARTLFTRSLQLLKDGGMEKETSEVLNRLGIINRRLSDFKASLQDFDAGIAVAKKYNQEPSLANLYMNKANTLNESASYDEAIRLHLESIRIKEKLKDERGLVQSYNNLANVYTTTSQLDQALQYYRLAASLSEKVNNKTSIALAYSNLAIASARLHRYDSVEYFYKRSLSFFEETNDKPGIAMVYTNLGNYYLDREEYQKSLDYLEKSLVMRKESKSVNDIASTTNSIGVVLRKLKRYDEAEEYLIRSLNMVRNDASGLQQTIYRTLGEHYQETGDFEKAATYQAKYISIKDTLLTEGEAINMVKAQSQYEIEKRENQLLLEKKEKELNAVRLAERNKTIWLMAGGLLLLLLTLGLYIRSYNQKKKAAKLLDEKNQRIETLVRELHHRVKNNLQVVSGLLSLQSNRTEDEKAKLAMEEGRSRINAMAMIHQRLYMDKDLAAIDVKDYLENLSQSLAGSFGYGKQNIQTDVRLPEASLDIDLVMPIGLIVNELVTNAFKHAFSGINEPSVTISLQQKQAKLLELQVADNGKGLVEEKTGSFGMKLVQTLVKQLNGKMTVQQNPGTAYTIEISV